MAIKDVTRVEKPWGFELIWAKTGDYVGKILHVNEGHQLSLQYHNEKEETILLYSGEMKFQFEGDNGEMEDIIMKAGDAHHIQPKRKHRMIAIKDCEIFEVSTPQLDDVVRIEDGYGRV